MDWDAVDPNILVAGPKTVDIHVLTTPYKNKEIEDKKEHRTKRRHTHSANSPLSEYRKLHRETRLREAAALNNSEGIERLLVNHNVNPNAADSRGRTALHIAASRGFVDAVTSLIKAGADVNVEDKLGNTPMHLAVYTGSAATVYSLIRGGAHLRPTKELKYSPLQLAESKYTMLQKHKTLLCQGNGALEIVNILRCVGDARPSTLQELDELASKVSQMGFEEASSQLQVNSLD